MRAPFQILAIPYKIAEKEPLFCVFHRADMDQWQFVAGGGEDDETPLQAAKREVLEETGVTAENMLELTSTCCVRADIFSAKHRKYWGRDTYVVPEYSFGFECNSEISLSHEHTQCEWLGFDEAMAILQFDSNKTALFELDCRLKNRDMRV